MLMVATLLFKNLLYLSKNRAIKIIYEQPQMFK